jgi:hypothetical protein
MTYPEVPRVTLAIAEPDPENDQLNREWRTATAWAQWRQYCCVEAGGHRWIAEVESIDEGGGVFLSCDTCPGGIDDLFPDAFAELYGEINGIPVTGGHALSLISFVAPVSVALKVEHYPSTPANGEEWDVWLEVASLDGCVTA